MEEKFEAIVLGILADNFATCQGFFDEDLIAGLRTNLLQRHADHRMHPAKVGRKFSLQQNADVRGDVISWIEEDTGDQSERAFLNTVAEFYQYLNRTCYTGINGLEFHYALYESGSFYKRHLDRFKQESGRQFSVVTYLNDEWTEADGGQLVLYLPDREVTILPKAGLTVFFKADEIEHEVKMAHRSRMSVAGWLLRV